MTPSVIWGSPALSWDLPWWRLLHNTANSLGGHAELNASVWDRNVVRALRVELLAEHLAQDTSRLDDCAAIQLYRQVAEANRRTAAHGASYQGLAIKLDAREYGR